jgi:RHS repeat-associated protein
LRYFGKHYEEHRSGGALDRDRYVFIAGERAAFLTDRAPGKVFYLHPEMPATAGLITDDHSVAAMSRLYGPFGEIQETRLGENPGRYGYRGAEQDDESGLIHLGVREYDAAMNRWSQPDAIISPLQPQSLNRYSYALNNPIRYVDPTGYKSYQEHLRMQPSPSGFNWETAQGSDCNWGGCDLVVMGADGTAQVVGLALSAHSGPPAQLLMLREMSKAAREQAAAARNIAQEIVDGLNGITQADGAGGAEPGVNVGRNADTGGGNPELSMLGKVRAFIHNNWQKAPGFVWAKIKDALIHKKSQAELENAEKLRQEMERVAARGEHTVSTPAFRWGGPSHSDGSEPAPVTSEVVWPFQAPPGYWYRYMQYGASVPYWYPSTPYEGTVP